MFLSKDSQLSARILGNVLNFPLYDGDCSPTARGLLAVGDVDGAIAEWRRLADLGSGRARCFLAYLALKGTPSSAPDIEEARRLASSALSGERGYANYVLACIALKEGQASSAVKYFADSHKAGFVPAATILGLAALGAKSASAKSRSGGEKLLRKAAASGHRPAQVALAMLCVRGRLGVGKRFLGLLLLPVALIGFAIYAKFHVFSIGVFQYSSRSTVPLFADASRLASARESSGRPRYVNILRFTHIAAGTAAAVVLVSQSSERSYQAIAAWIALAAWPYALSYFIAAGAVGRNLVAVSVETLFLTLVTAFACDTYIGRTFGIHLSTWMIVASTIVQAIALMLASGFGTLGAGRVVRTIELVPHRQLILSAHLVLGFLAASAIFMRSAVWQVEYLRRYGLDVVTHSLLALLPYVAVALFALPLVTKNRWKPWAYLGILVVGTAVAVMGNSGVIVVPQGLVVMAQFIGFGLAAEWALDGNEW